MSKAKAILFDLDGTLINSEFQHFCSWNDILLPFNAQLSFNFYMNEYSGISLLKNAERLNREFDLKRSITDLMIEKDSFYLQRLERNSVELMPYALEVLRYFYQLRIPMGLVTSSSRKAVELIVKNGKLQQYFSNIITRDDVNNFKPHPEPYQMAAKSLGYLDNEYIVFEDSFPGINSAIGANLTCFFIKNQFTQEIDFEEHKFLSFDNLEFAKQYLIDNNLLAPN